VGQVCIHLNNELGADIQRELESCDVGAAQPKLSSAVKYLEVAIKI
jgi:hypothetical protein